MVSQTARQFRRESACDSVIDVWRINTASRDRSECSGGCVIRGRTTQHQARNAARGCGDLERRDGVECDAVTDPDHALAVLAEEAAHESRFEIRTVSESEAWSNGPLEVAFVPMISRN